MISGIFILDIRGDAIISRIYRDDVQVKDVEAFKLHVLKASEVKLVISTISLFLKIVFEK